MSKGVKWDILILQGFKDTTTYIIYEFLGFDMDIRIIFNRGSA